MTAYAFTRLTADALPLVHEGLARTPGRSGPPKKAGFRRIGLQSTPWGRVLLMQRDTPS